MQRLWAFSKHLADEMGARLKSNVGKAGEEVTMQCDAEDVLVTLVDPQEFALAAEPSARVLV